MPRPHRRAVLRFALASGVRHTLGFAVLALLPAGAFAQGGEWQLLEASPSHTYRFEDASFLSPLHGWIVDGAGRTHRTLDGGASWELMSDTTSYHRTTAFVSETHGWVGTLFSPQKLFETRDAGATLVDATTRITPAITGGICGMWAIDADTVVAVGQYSGPAYVVRTTDGGQTWQSQDLTGLAGSLIDVVFLDDRRGFAVGGTRSYNVPDGRVVVLATVDGGATWAQRYVASAPPAGQGEWGWKVSFPTPDVGYVSVERLGGTTAKVLKTVDGGQTWTELAVPGGGSLQGLGFITPQRGWISGRGLSMETTDGGTTWTPTTAIDGSVNRFEFFDGELGYAMGERVYFIDTRTTPAVAAPSGAPTALHPVAPNPARGAATLRYRVAGAGAVELTLYDALGRRVAVLAAGAAAAGAHEARWDGRDASGARAAAGVYLARLTAGETVHARTFVFSP